jgi:hypothetical protein
MSNKYDKRTETFDTMLHHAYFTPTVYEFLTLLQYSNLIVGAPLFHKEIFLTEFGAKKETSVQ